MRNNFYVTHPGVSTRNSLLLIAQKGAPHSTDMQCVSAVHPIVIQAHSVYGMPDGWRAIQHLKSTEIVCVCT